MIWAKSRLYLKKDESIISDNLSCIIALSYTSFIDRDVTSAGKIIFPFSRLLAFDFLKTAPHNENYHNFHHHLSPVFIAPETIYSQKKYESKWDAMDKWSKLRWLMAITRCPIITVISNGQAIKMFFPFSNFEMTYIPIHLHRLSPHIIIYKCKLISLFSSVRRS